MQQPPKNSAYGLFVKFSDYTVGATKTRFGDLSDACRKASDVILGKGRAWEDAARTVTFAQGERDGQRGQLVAVVQATRKSLEGDSLTGLESPEYKSVFAEGVDYFTRAKLADLPTRLDDLASRLAALGDEHPVHKKFSPQLASARAAYDAASKALTEARSARKRARNTLQAALDGWSTTIEQTYGALIQKVGVRDADDYFPTKDREDDDEDPTPTPS